MNFYAVIDTNVLVSAMIKWNSVPGQIMEFAFNGIITPVYNEEILAEYRTVLSHPKFHLPDPIIKDIIDGIEENGLLVHADSIDIDMPDPKDIVFYEVTMKQRETDNETYLVTGNIRHFPINTFIVTPRQMLDIMIDAVDKE